eukprot:Tamp_33507.p2 GENE.Tamp_33507~~Tamp_33507.p2  ORF type:complete len:108 (+),score=9.34 Tamp_33507:291-614(+)
MRGTPPQLISHLLVTRAGEVKIGPPNASAAAASSSTPNPQSADDIKMEVNEKQDVTGGMRTKVECAANIVAKCRVPVFIAQVATEDSQQMLEGNRPRLCSALLPADS